METYFATPYNTYKMNCNISVHIRLNEIVFQSDQKVNMKNTNTIPCLIFLLPLRLFNDVTFFAASYLHLLCVGSILDLITTSTIRITLITFTFQFNMNSFIIDIDVCHFPCDLEAIPLNFHTKVLCSVLPDFVCPRLSTKATTRTV